MQPKVCVLTTGGTIGHRSGKDGVAVMDFDPGSLARSIGVGDVALSFHAVLHKGSMDVVPDDWVRIAAAAVEVITTEEPAGVVILHGTDTLHYTAAALSFMLQGLGVPVVLTGSMIPGGDPGSDSQPNLRDAIRVAAAADLAEVVIVFSADRTRSKGLILRGNRARKLHSTAIDAFVSVNLPPLGTVTDREIALTEPGVTRRSPAKPALTTALERNVVLVKLTPAVTPDSLMGQLQGAAGAVLEGTGVGHIKTDLQPTISAFGKPVIVTTQTVFGGERLGAYDVDKHILAIPNLVPGGDMTSETALVKLMWALKQDGEVTSILRRNIVGER